MGAHFAKAATLRVGFAAVSQGLVAKDEAENSKITLSSLKYSAAEVVADTRLLPPIPPLNKRISDSSSVGVIVKDAYNNIHIDILRAEIKVEISRVLYEAGESTDPVVKRGLEELLRHSEVLGVRSEAGLANMLCAAVDEYIHPYIFHDAIYSLNGEVADGAGREVASLMVGRRISRWHSCFVSSSGTTQALVGALATATILDATAQDLRVAAFYELLDRVISDPSQWSQTAILTTFFVVLLAVTMGFYLMYEGKISANRMTLATETVVAHAHKLPNGPQGPVTLPIGMMSYVPKSHPHNLT
jgi:hypothetical protein